MCPGPRDRSCQRPGRAAWATLGAVVSPAPDVVSREDGDTRGGASSPAKARIVSAAIALFATRGVGGTSLQMIADAIGVTKAAVYHQFKTKDEIVIAAAEAELARVEAVLDAAAAKGDPDRVRDALLAGIVDLAIERRRMESTLTGDPVLARFYAHNAHFRQVMERLFRMLTGDDPAPDAPMTAAMLSAAIGGAVMHPLAAGLDDATLRAQLLRLGRRFLGLPEAPAES
jgi:AcrR family transcriptional regulator